VNGTGGAAARRSSLETLELAMPTVNDVELIGGDHQRFNSVDIDGVLERISNAGVAINGIREVSAYLASHMDLLGVVDCLPTMLVMEPRVPIARTSTLEIYHDPEIEDEYLRLSLHSGTFEYPFIEVLDRFQAWLAVELKNKSGWFQVSPTF
jgi:hypothetical protein